MTHKITIFDTTKQIRIEIESKEEEFVKELSHDVKRFLNLGHVNGKISDLSALCKSWYKHGVVPHEGPLKEAFDDIYRKFPNIDKEIVDEILTDILWGVGTHIAEIDNLLNEDKA